MVRSIEYSGLEPSRGIRALLADAQLTDGFTDVLALGDEDLGLPEVVDDLLSRIALSGHGDPFRRSQSTKPTGHIPGGQVIMAQTIVMLPGNVGVCKLTTAHSVVRLAPEGGGRRIDVPRYLRGDLVLGSP